jgi:hypothetical protein
MRSLMALALIILLGVIADGFSAAHAQCATTDKIYIDPRLVPKPLDISKEKMNHILASPYTERAIKEQMWSEYVRKGQPIVVPYGTGKVLVNPTNPCIQQYIP